MPRILLWDQHTESYSGHNYKLWVYSFKIAVAPTIDPLLANPTATADLLDGTILVANPGSANVNFTVVVVKSDPCPTVEWRFAGSSLSGTDYSFNNPCIIVNQTYSFYLIVASLTANSSGHYSAMFYNQGGSTTIGFTITVPGKQDDFNSSVFIHAHLPLTDLLLITTLITLIILLLLYSSFWSNLIEFLSWSTRGRSANLPARR